MKQNAHEFAYPELRSNIANNLGIYVFIMSQTTLLKLTNPLCPYTSAYARLECCLQEYWLKIAQVAYVESNSKDRVCMEQHQSKSLWMARPRQVRNKLLLQEHPTSSRAKIEAASWNSHLLHPATAPSEQRSPWAVALPLPVRKSPRTVIILIAQSGEPCWQDMFKSTTPVYVLVASGGKRDLIGFDMLQIDSMSDISTYICICIHTRTHTHTHIYIYILYKDTHTHIYIYIHIDVIQLCNISLVYRIWYSLISLISPGNTWYLFLLLFVLRATREPCHLRSPPVDAWARPFELLPFVLPPDRKAQSVQVQDARTC